MTEGNHRERILGRVRTALGRDGAPDPAAVARARTEALGDGPVQRPVWDGPDRARFRRCLEQAAATTAEVDGLGAAGPAIADWLGDTLPAGTPLHVARDPRLDAIEWPEGLATARPSHGRDALAAVSHADCAVAETGSVVLLSGAANPMTLAFLPDYHVVVVNAQDLVATMEDAWARLRGLPDFPPRAVNWITGPSRTADVEQTLQLGAHGPRSLHVVLVG